MRAQQLPLVWQWAFLFAEAIPVTRLAWEGTELGRRSTDRQFQIVRNFKAGGWRLLDAAWIEIATLPSLAAAEYRAEQIAARAAAIHRRENTTCGSTGGAPPPTTD